jgi:hypothetical protein
MIGASPISFIEVSARLSPEGNWRIKPEAAKGGVNQGVAE